MTTEEEIAKAFYERFQQLSPLHGSLLRRPMSSTWEQASDDDRNLIIAVVTDLLDNGIIWKPDPATSET